MGPPFPARGPRRLARTPNRPQTSTEQERQRRQARTRRPRCLRRVRMARLKTCRTAMELTLRNLRQGPWGKHQRHQAWSQTMGLPFPARSRRRLARTPSRPQTSTEPEQHQQVQTWCPCLLLKGNPVRLKTCREIRQRPARLNKLPLGHWDRHQRHQAL